MIKAKIYDNNTYDTNTYYFNNLSELTDYLTNYNVTLIWKEEE